MKDRDKQINEIINRNTFALTAQARVDTDSFCFHDYVMETLEMAKLIDYNDGIVKCRLLFALRDIIFGKGKEAITSLELFNLDIEHGNMSLRNQLLFYGMHMFYYASRTAEFK